MPNLTNRTLLITGASMGVGAAAAKACAAAGARVLIHYGASRQAAEAVAEETGAPAADLLQADLSEPGAGDKLWDDALARAGRIDALVNNAGVYAASPLTDANAWDSGWTRNLQVNLRAPADLARRAVMHFREGGQGGVIVNVASRAGHRGDDIDHPAYAAAKAGLIALTKTIARGCAHDRILAYAIAPGWIATRMARDEPEALERARQEVPLGDVASPEEIGDLIAFLCTGSQPSMTGATLDMNGASYVR